jgi:hypothetical protein
MLGRLRCHDDPTEDLHAVTKRCVDDAVAGVGGGTALDAALCGARHHRWLVRWAVPGT